MVKKEEGDMKRIVYYWLPVFLWAFMIFGFSANPTGSVSEVHWQDFVVKKLAHVFVYGVLSTLLYRALKKSGVPKKKAITYSIYASIIYGITDEYHQSFTPGREPRARDIIFDTIGAVLSMSVVYYYFPNSDKFVKKLAKYFELI